MAVTAIAQNSFTAQSLVEQLDSGALLRQPGTLPFHLKADFAATGMVEFKGSGTYEEWWTSNSLWRKEVALDKYHLVLICRDGKITRESSEDYIPMRVQELLNAILPSVPAPENMASNKTWTLEPTTLQGLTMQRLASSGAPPKDGKRGVPENAYYILPARHLVVMRAVGYDLYLYDKPAQLGGRSVMLDGKFKRNDATALEFHITSLKANDAMDPSLFQPSQDAKLGFAFGVPSASQWQKRPQIIDGTIDWERLRSRGHGGEMLADLQIDSHGLAREVDVIFETDKMLGDFITYDLRHFKFEPMLVDGKAQTFSYQFKTTENERRADWNYK